MNNTLTGWELVISSRHTNSLSRGDIVLVTDAVKGNIVKRLIGLPGETIEILDGVVYINKYQLKEPYIEEENALKDNMPPKTLLSTEVFLLGDNRQNSFDSRDPYFGRIDLVGIKAKVLYKFNPFPCKVKKPTY